MVMKSSSAPILQKHPISDQHHVMTSSSAEVSTANQEGVANILLAYAAGKLLRRTVRRTVRGVLGLDAHTVLASDGMTSVSDEEVFTMDKCSDSALAGENFTLDDRGQAALVSRREHYGILPAMSKSVPHQGVSNEKGTWNKVSSTSGIAPEPSKRRRGVFKLEGEKGSHQGGDERSSDGDDDRQCIKKSKENHYSGYQRRLRCPFYLYDPSKYGTSQACSSDGDFQTWLNWCKSLDTMPHNWSPQDW